MVFYAAFNSISVISQRQLTLFMLSWVSPVLGWALKCLAQGQSHKKTQRIQCGSDPGPLDYESNTLPLSHVGPFTMFGKWLKVLLYVCLYPIINDVLCIADNFLLFNSSQENFSFVQLQSNYCRQQMRTPSTETDFDMNKNVLQKISVFSLSLAIFRCFLPQDHRDTKSFCQDLKLLISV